jgi:hypothetical protein
VAVTGATVMPHPVASVFFAFHERDMLDSPFTVHASAE